MLSKKELKQQEENRKLAAFCRYLRKNPDLFNEHNLHQLMLDDQNKKGCPLESGPEPAIPEEPVEIVIEASSEKIDEPIAKSVEPELKEKKKRVKKEPKEKKPRKSKKKEEKLEKVEDKSEELKLSDLPEGPYPLERQQADPCLDANCESEHKKIEPGPVDEIKESGN